MRTFSRLALAVGLSVALAGSASAQRPGGQGRFGGGGGGVGSLIRAEAVQKELKMDKEQADKAAEAVKKVTDKHADDYAKLRDLPQEERRTKGQELARQVNEETLAAVGEVLKPEQVKRLKQLELQRAGFAAYTRADVQSALKLSDDQKEKVKGITEEANKQIRELTGAGGAGGARPARGAGGRGGANAEKVTALRKEAAEKISAVLTAEQKTTWKDLTGEAFAFPAPQRPAPKTDN